MRFIVTFLLALSILLVLSFNAHATSRISRFYDGDTVKIEDGHKHYKLRISHIDAPERNQTYGKNKLGLWASEKPMPPWVWRHLLKHQ